LVLVGGSLVTLPLAHVGHWYHVLLYLLPILLIGAGLWWSNRRELRRESEAEQAPQEPQR
jgi:cytochrome c-type biogenesis protein CcmH/NrfF